MIKTIRVSVSTLAMILAMGVAAETSQGSGPLCQCRDRDGQRRDLGSVDCFDISGKQSLFRCEMSTNTPYWKRIDKQDGCPLARLIAPPLWLSEPEVASAP